MRLHVHEWGEAAAPPLVCLHGISGGGRQFRKLAEERWSQRFHVLAPDLRGHGSSGYDPPWDIETHVDDVLETVRDAGVDRATWIGLSFGGRLVLELAAREPELVERVVLLDPAIQILPHVALDMAELARDNTGFESVEEAVESRLSTIPTSPREFVEEDRRERLDVGRDGRLRFRFCASAVVVGYSEVATTPPDPKTLRVPTLLVYAPNFGLVLEEQVDAYQTALGDLLTLRPVPGGHMVIWDAHAETAEAVDEFLARES